MTTDFLPEVDTVFTDPNDPTWTIVSCAGKKVILHECADVAQYSVRVDTGTLDRKGTVRGKDVSADACWCCTQEPPPGFIALYKLYTWDDK
jgi:hypothetical protein